MLYEEIPSPNLDLNSVAKENALQKSKFQFNAQAKFHVSIELMVPKKIWGSYMEFCFI